MLNEKAALEVSTRALDVIGTPDVGFEFYFAQIWIITHFPFLLFSSAIQSQFKPSPSTFLEFLPSFPLSISPYVFILTVRDFYNLSVINLRRELVTFSTANREI